MVSYSSGVACSRFRNEATLIGNPTRSRKYATVRSLMSAAFSWKPNGVSSSTAGTGREPRRESRSACTDTIVGVVSPDPMMQSSRCIRAAPPVAFMPRSYGVRAVRPFTEARTRALAAIDAGRMDGMPWYTRDRVEASADIGGRYPWARSIVALAWPYRPAGAPIPREAAAGVVRGRCSAYACTEDGGRAVDYHDLLAQR